MSTTDESPSSPAPVDPSHGALPPPTLETRYDRFRSEVMAGGSVTERPAEPFGGGPVGAIGGVAILALLVWLGFTNIWMFLFVVGILASVFLHELGHFVTARMTGMKATQFFIGFGPRLWSFHRGETEYGVRLLPLGAFVRIIGMNNMDEVPLEDEGRTYRQATFPRRMLVITAGSLMHLLIAVVLFFCVFATKGKLVETDGAEVGRVTTGQDAASAGLQPGQGAGAAGIESGDVILSVGGVAIGSSDDALGQVIREFAPGETVEIVYSRDGQEFATDATLGASAATEGPTVGKALLGVTSGPATAWEHMSVPTAARTSVTDLFPTAWQSVKGVVTVFNPVNIWNHLSGATDDLTTRPATVVGATQISGDVGEHVGLAGVIYMLAALNVFIGVFNMFPLLPLDGGHAAIAIYERIREIKHPTRRYFADVSRLMPFAMGVIAVLLFVFVSGLYLEISKPF